MDLVEEENNEIGGALHSHPQYINYIKHDSNGSGRGGIRASGGGGSNEGSERRMVDITRDKPIKVAVRVQVPVRDHPKFNFVGKLLGPKGNSLKRLQEDTMCKMAVLGRGSMKDRQKEEELRVSGDPKFSHLMEDLHVEISAYATPAEAHARIAYALAEVRRFLVPDYNDDIRQEQMWEMQILNTQNREGPQVVEAPLSPASSLDAASSPTAATTANSIDGQDDTPSRPTPSPPHPATLKTQGTVLQAVTSTLGGRKRPLLPGGRLAMSPTKRTVMSLLARARAAQNKEPLQTTASIITATHPQPTAPLIQATLQLPTGGLQSATQSPQLPNVGSPQVSQLQLAAQSMPQHTTVTQRQPILQSHTQHQVLAPTIHGLLHAQRAAAGATVVPILREDFMAGINQHQVQNVHIA
ncbi:KH domain-containing, RNA-binding, signal transduction-associated protein 2 [Belonocnema kinseyi]|uniref:KH domain-containing, RNA-binding, signal transduction-associated protein 2 n=1 Tax=Belonocnema kinseyi TaxID=2817044 RepID=UPI00143D26F3|nr:KH domain-containing, RNA-binding, signal transduction-associated protein 2 [Belonocnema kinseyi]XP_033210343.1 KH domain-containing, RNA-binding, signal transduction-associated protein 2 [Belonocnema kinseyi]XP_033210344.1 KH domain-containing, RNA-binding, signal transduction-associated protein 2 [Belonocnema kinseyi]XP_033210345.1 KH domain-containing, RNA-binding, signal transduction-associated protein 2 [Belonocnema kinseyi]XP_033210346.1 KH domain-containing, RNA-binding, signal transd